MNVRLQHDIDFLAGIYFENSLQFNSYSVVMNILTSSNNPARINVAMERLKAFVYSELANVVFINRQHEEQAELFHALGVNICTLPDEPVDQIIGLMLYCKLNAIMEGQLTITGLDIKSELGDNVWYLHDEEESMGPFSQDGWWHKHSTQKESLNLDDTPENVVKVHSTGWKEYGLEWPEETKDSNAKVIFPKFNKDENK